jgi:hypothetical protein
MEIFSINKTRLLILILTIGGSLALSAQDSIEAKKDTVRPVDATDILRKIFGKEEKTEKKPKTSTFAILPTFSYNPSFGVIIGGKLTGGKQFGDPRTTNYSVFAIDAIITSKGIISVQVKHNVFVADNRWNWQGQWQVAHYGLQDYGLGTGGQVNYESKGFALNQYSTENSDSAFPIKYGYIRLTERGYRKVGKHFYAGGGIRLDLYSNIEDEKQTNALNTPHQRYSLRHDFDPKKYSSNGFIVALQYNTRDHPVRPYKGFYGDMDFQFDQKWIGSSKNAIRLEYDLRKYFSLSKRNPEHVLAFWHWAVYKLSGELPYLELPSTACDPYGRSGRAYTFSRFKGPAYAYFESEWRFPITRNKLISGVCFLNLQTASNDRSTKVFEAWEPGGGVGLRILFQKQSRTSLCIDLAKGRYGAQGLFFGLGEAF